MSDHPKTRDANSGSADGSRYTDGGVGPSGRPIPLDPDALLDEVEAAFLICASPRTLQAQRLRGGGPPFVRLGKRRGGAISPPNLSPVLDRSRVPLDLRFGRGRADDGTVPKQKHAFVGVFRRRAPLAAVIRPCPSELERHVRDHHIEAACERWAQHPLPRYAGPEVLRAIDDNLISLR